MPNNFHIWQHDYQTGKMDLVMAAKKFSIYEPCSNEFVPYYSLICQITRKKKIMMTGIKPFGGAFVSWLFDK